MRGTFILVSLLVKSMAAFTPECNAGDLDKTLFIPVPDGAPGIPSRAADLDVLPGFRTPPPGYGEVPFWWWSGDSLDVSRLIWELDQLHEKGISGVQVNYAHEDSPGWPTYRSDPAIFSEAWWGVWQQVTEACRQRGMGIGLSTYTLDWTGADNLFRQLFYSKPELNALKLEPLPERRLVTGQILALDVPEDLVLARAYPVDSGWIRAGGLSLSPAIQEGHLSWTAPEGEWAVWLVRAERMPNTLNPLRSGIGERVAQDFYQRFQDAMPDRSYAGLNYFFNDELQIGAGPRAWNEDFEAEFLKRKGYDLQEFFPALWTDMGSITPKVRMDYADVRMSLMEERYFQPVYRWHAERGLIFACDAGGRGLQPDEFGDYFRATRWYTAPGHDTPGGHADLIKGKVSSSIASLYRRPRVWLEGYHSLGWGATPERLMLATRENYLYGCTLLNLHGLYYSTHGSFWEWAPPCYHFRMPYWEHMDTFLKYFERLSFLMSQGTFVCDVAVLYPVAPFEAGLDGQTATQVAFETGRSLMKAGVNFEFLDAESLARARVCDHRLEVSDSSYRVLIFPSMEAVRWSSLEKAKEFEGQGGLVISVGDLPLASDRAGRDDEKLESCLKTAMPEKNRVPSPGDVSGLILSAFTPDTCGEKTVRSHHRKIGARDVYMVMDAQKGSVVEFRAKGRVELWDPWTGETRPLRVMGETRSGTRVEMPLEDYEAQIVVFTPGQKHVDPISFPDRPLKRIPLEGEWTFELRPTLDNRYGDFRLPSVDPIIGPEARIFRHAVESGVPAAWQDPALDDSGWERVTYDFGPQFWVLGPMKADTPPDVLDAELAKLTRVDPDETILVSGQTLRWHPYSLSWRWGLEGDPGHQGWHGLKEAVTDHFLCLGKREDGLNEFVYGPEDAGSRTYLWTSATVDQEIHTRMMVSVRIEGQKPHASDVLSPAAVFLNGLPVKDLNETVLLRPGSNPILIRYDRPGRGYFVLRRDEADGGGGTRTPLAMTWFDDPSLIRLDVLAGARPAEWFRFVAPPGLRAIKVVTKGSVEVWANGERMRPSGQDRFEATGPLARSSVVALRVMPECGFSAGAVFPEPIRLECGPGVVSLGDWSGMGVLECYSGGALYGKNVSLSPEDMEGPITLDLGRVVASAEVRVNGQLAGIRVAPPWRVDISKQVKPGENRIEVKVFNTLANHYLTIPTHYQGDRTSGLLGPVALELISSIP